MADTTKKPGLYETLYGGYRDIGLPLLGIIEAIATEGKSPGTTALTQRNILLQGEESKRAREEKKRKRELQESLYGMKTTDFIAKQNEAALKKARQQSLAKKLVGLTKPEDIRKVMTEFAGETGDVSSLLKLTKPEKDFTTELAEALTLAQGKGQIAEQFKIAGEERKKVEKEQEEAAKVEKAKEGLTKNLAIYNKLGDLVTPGGYIGGGLNTAKAFAKKVFGVDDPTVALENMAGIMSNQIARVLGGEKGVMTDRDIARVATLKYSPFDAPGERTIKKRTLELLTAPGLSPDDIRARMDESIAEIYGLKAGTEVAPTPQSPTMAPAAAKTFNSVEEAEAANLPKGTVIWIQGRKAVVE